MSICGNCPCPYEDALIGVPNETWTEEDREDYEDNLLCSHGCSFEDAVYRCQMAYDRLFDRYEALQAELNDVLCENNILKERLKQYESSNQ